MQRLPVAAILPGKVIEICSDVTMLNVRATVQKIEYPIQLPAILVVNMLFLRIQLLLVPLNV